LDRLQDLDLTTNKIVEAIIKQEDVFVAAHDALLSSMQSLRIDTVANIVVQHEITRDEIVRLLLWHVYYCN
jgi:hypothetical protein